MKPSLFSISYAGFWGQATLKLTDFIANAGKMGFPAVMIAGKRPHLSPLDATPEFIQPIQDALKKANVRCEVLAAYTNLGQTSQVGCEVPVIEFQISYVEALARIATQTTLRCLAIPIKLNSSTTSDKRAIGYGQFHLVLASSTTRLSLQDFKPVGSKAYRPTKCAHRCAMVVN